MRSDFIANVKLTKGFHFVSHKALKLSWCFPVVASLSCMKYLPPGAAIL